MNAKTVKKNGVDLAEMILKKTDGKPVGRSSLRSKPVVRRTYGRGVLYSN